MQYRIIYIYMYKTHERKEHTFESVRSIVFNDFQRFMTYYVEEKKLFSTTVLHNIMGKTSELKEQHMMNKRYIK